MSKDFEIDSIHPLVSEYAYDIEAQALVVADAQSNGDLNWVNHKLFRKKIADEWGQRWVVLDRTVLFYNHCNMGIYDRLERDQTFSVINTRYMSDWFTFGQTKSAAAAVFVDTDILYRSPGFNLESWNIHLRLKRLEEEIVVKRLVTQLGARKLLDL